MRSRRRALEALVVGLTLLACQQAPAADLARRPPQRVEWATFGGDLERDGHPPGATLTPAGATHLARAWGVELGEDIVASPTVTGGVLVIGTVAGSLVALSTEDGREVWRATGLGPIVGAATISGGKVIVGSTAGRLYAFDLRDGKRIWDWRAPGRQPAFWGSPSLFRGLLIVGVGGPVHAETAEAGVLVALDPASGDLVWSACARSACAAGGEITSSPAIDATGHLFVGLGPPESSVLAADVGIGREQWRSRLPAGEARPPGNGWTPVVLSLGGKEVVGIRAGAGLFAVLNAANGALLWSRRLSTSSPGESMAGSAATDGARFFVPSDGPPTGLMALDAGDGHTVWTHGVTENVLSSPALAAGVVVLATGSVQGADARGELQALAAGDGSLLWRSERGPAIVGSPAIVGERIYAANRAGGVSAYQPGP